MLKKDCRKNAFKCTRQPFLVLWVVLLSSRFPACFSISGKSKKRVHVLNLERVNSKKLGSKATVSRTYLILILLCIDEAIYLTLLCKGKKSRKEKRDSLPRESAQLLQPKKTFINFIQSTASSLVQLFFLESLVFICREHSRVSKILLFPDCPRFCRLMKTRNRKYLRASGMDGIKSGESGAFIFSRRVPDFCDGRRSFLTNENSHLYSQGRRRWISLITNPYHK